MTSILKKIYHGDIIPQELFAPKSEEYCAEVRARFKKYEGFIKKLEPPLDEEFIKLMDEYLDDMPYDFTEMFNGGFKLGIMLMIEILLQDNILNDL